MKHVAQLLKPACVAMLCMGIILSCRKTDTGMNPGNPNPPGDSVTNADSLSDRLRFFEATKKQGAIPKGPGGSSLKISFEDTLYLTDEVKLPVKFQHLDTAQNVAGIYVQVQAAAIGGPLDATYYYDVPELPEMGSSDTVSVIMIGINPTGLVLPLSFNITITPYNSRGLPIAQAIRPVKIAEKNIDPKSNGGSCGLVLPDGEYWDWEVSIIGGGSPLDFEADPDKIFGAGGQFIRGNCCNGVSTYGFCSPFDTTLNARLHFATYYRIMAESLTFHDDGTFFRQTFEDGADPLPASSDFCGSAEGVIKYNLSHTTYNGNYTVTLAAIPPDLQVYRDDSLRLGLQTTSSSPQGSGYGNPGGIIHQLDCNIGELVLIQVDLEGFGKHLYKFYTRRSFNKPLRWYPFG